jgi:hypothetical protein
MNQKLNIWTKKYSRDYSLLVPWGYDSHKHMLQFAMCFWNANWDRNFHLMKVLIYRNLS